MFITIEGLPYSGKKNQQLRLANHLETLGFKPVVCSQQTGWDKELSGIINFMATEGRITPVERLFLFLADRAGFCGRFVPTIYKYGGGAYVDAHNNPVGGRPAVVCVGGPDSTLAFQGFGDQVASVKDIALMNAIASQGTQIDLTFVIDISPEEMMKRVPLHEKKKFEEKGLPFYQRVRQGYHAIADVESNRVCMLDGSGSEDEIHAGILSELQERLRKHKG